MLIAILIFILKTNQLKDHCMLAHNRYNVSIVGIKCGFCSLSNFGDAWCMVQVRINQRSSKRMQRKILHHIGLFPGVFHCIGVKENWP